jgi:nucleotide-binding universal stress UspA family protein
MKEPTMFKHILVATDGSQQADRAVRLALRVAGHARVTALMVVPDYGTAEFAKAMFTNEPDIHELRKSLAEKGMARLQAVLAQHGPRAREIECRVAVSDHAHEEIVGTARREHCDLIVMGSRGHGALASTLLGSQTQRVLASATLPVLVAPASVDLSPA